MENKKSKAAAAVLAFFLGIYGAHCFYLGDKKMGFIRLAVGLVCTVIMYTLLLQLNPLYLVFNLAVGAMAIWALVDFIQILRNKRTDATGNALV